MPKRYMPDQSLPGKSMPGQVLEASEMQNIASLLNRKYAGLIKDRYFEVETSLDFRGVYAKLILRNQSGSFFYPVEGRIQHMAHARSVREAGLLLLDHLTDYFDQYLHSDGEVYLPIDWEDYEVEGVCFQMKGQILNLEMERLADLWLEGKFEDLPDDALRH